MLQPGDLLYLPRGWYHDALAEAPASVHIAYGVHAPLGMDLLNILLERALYDAEFRKPLPRQDGSAAARFALTSRAGQLGQRLAELCRDPKVMEVLERFVADYRFQRGGNDILAARGLAAPAAALPRRRRGRAGLPRAAARREAGAPRRRLGAEDGRRRAAPLPPAEAEAAGWLLARPDVAEPELRAAHPGVDAPALLARLREAGLLAAGMTNPA